MEGDAMKLDRSERTKLGVVNPLQNEMNWLADMAAKQQPRQEWYLVDFQGAKVRGRFKTKTAALGWAARWGNAKFGCTLRARLWVEDLAGLTTVREIHRQQKMGCHRPHDQQKKYNQMVIELEQEPRGAGQTPTKPAGSFWGDGEKYQRDITNEQFRAEQINLLIRGMI